MAVKDYKYKRQDFGDLPLKLNHLTIHLNFMDDFVEATNCLDMTAGKSLEKVELDAKNLEIIRVEWLEKGPVKAEAGIPLHYEYRDQQDRLVIELPHVVEEGRRFFVRTVTRCRPSNNLLEGIYKDITSPGAPQQYISQCQQWGFQRIMPIFDDCRAKCTMTTTIEADARYTHLISNGNICRETNPNGVPVTVPGNAQRQVITYENSIPMAPYLFLVAAGTWDTLTDEVIFPSGRRVSLQYLVPPGRTTGAEIPMEILKASVLWIAETQDYEYTGDTYRTICMTKSNFGGMENVGNTTIVTDAALVDEHTPDQSLLYAHGVIVHEFEHNQCGSETTMETPFDLWLNEAYTVHVERHFLADVFNPTFVRLHEVDSIRHPLLGPLAIEDGGRAGRIVRDGFNNPDELVDAVTYVKAAEVIRMLELILGADKFKAAKSLYFSRYRNSNANTDQFFQCFEEVSGQCLDQFKKGWLYTLGYPNVTATTAYHPQRTEYEVLFRQHLDPEHTPFHLPIEVALVGRDGRTIPGTEQIFQLKDEHASLVFGGIDQEPAFASLNRDYSFYGTFKQEDATTESLALQARLDTNAFNRIEAMTRLTDVQRVRLLLDPEARVDESWLSTYGEILRNTELPPALKAYFLRIEEQPLDRRYCTWFPELVVARETLMLAVNRAFRDELVNLFNQIDTYRPRSSPKDGIEERLLKNLLLSLIVADDSSAGHRMILEHCERSLRPADRIAALALLNRSSYPGLRDVLEETYEAWHGHSTGYPNYLRIIAAGSGEDYFLKMERERARADFDVNRPSLSRALFVSAAANNKMVWTDQGIPWVADTVIWLSAVNDYIAGRMLNTFQQFRNMKPDLRERVRPHLERIVREVSEEMSPAVHGQASAYLNGLASTS